MSSLPTHNETSLFALIDEGSFPRWVLMSVYFYIGLLVKRIDQRPFPEAHSSLRSSTPSRRCLRLVQVRPAHSPLLGRQVVRPDGAPAAERVQLGDHPPVVDLLEHRVEDRPRGGQFVRPDEEPLVAVEDVQDEALVRVGDLVVVVPGGLTRGLSGLSGGWARVANSKNQPSSRPPQQVTTGQPDDKTSGS